MASLDLDARRAESKGEPHEVTVGGVSYELPPTLPMYVAECLSKGAVLEACVTLVGEAAAPGLARELDVNEVTAILEELYGFDSDDDAPAPNRAARRAK
ncbi:MAG: hypothetical protein ABIP03_11690 [Aquihabitans sp.]